jgi:hypothetical protein
MFSLYGSLLGDGSEDAAFLKALASVPRASFTRLRFCRRLIHREISLCLNWETARTRVPPRNSHLLPGILRDTSRKVALKDNQQSTQINKTVKSRLSRAMKARARLRQQHRIRSLFVARNK